MNQQAQQALVNAANANSLAQHLRLRVEAMESQLTQLTYSLTAAQSLIADLTTRLEALEERLA